VVIVSLIVHLTKLFKRLASNNLSTQLSEFPRTANLASLDYAQSAHVGESDSHRSSTVPQPVHVTLCSRPDLYGNLVNLDSSTQILCDGKKLSI
jgi:hypothetical protein